MKYRKLVMLSTMTKSVILIICVIGVRCGEVSEWSGKTEDTIDLLFQHTEAPRGVKLLQNAANQGNNDAESDLTFAKLLGLGLTQDIEWAAKTSLALVDSGGARAHTTQGLLLSHNLAGRELSEEERLNQALSHYLVAAINKDPVAQIIVARHYLKKGDCEAALQYLRKAATSVATLSEEGTPKIPVQYLWPEDDSGSSFKNKMPTLDELQFMEFSAQGGDIEAALAAAMILFTPIPGLRYDPELAIIYLRQAAEANSTSAMIMIAAIHLHKSIKPDQNDTLELLQEALAQGDVAAHTYLGLLHLEGFGEHPKNLAKAKYHLEEGIKIGSVEALYLLGKLHSVPEGPGNPNSALSLWETSASYGHVPSAYKVAEKYNQKLQIAALTTVTPDGSSAVIDKLCENTVPLYRLVAMSGKWQNLHQIAYEDYRQGYTSSALMKYLLLSDLGYSAAHVNAGRLLDSSGNALYETDDAATNEIVKIWQRAADAGIAIGHLRLGDLYYYGDGVSKNLKTASDHYKKASLLGSGHGTFSAAQMAEWGEGVERNLTRARELYESALNTHSDAYIPVFLALVRMDFLIGIGKIFNVDFYAHSLMTRPRQYLYGAIPPWDIMLMTVLLSVISWMITNRNRQ